MPKPDIHSAKDPICGAMIDHHSAISTEDKGKTYYFCGNTCRQQFLYPAKSSKTKTKKDLSCC